MTFQPSSHPNPSAGLYPRRSAVGVDVARERIRRDGAAGMTDAELVAVVVDADTRTKADAEEAGRRIMGLCGGDVRRLLSVGDAELGEAVPGLKRRTLGRVLAAVELGRRVAAAAEAPPEATITGTASALAFCRRRFARLATDGVQEEFHVVTLDTRHHVIGTHRVTVGTLDASLVHPREVFRPTLRDAAAAVLLVHNHPSGDPSPSPEDHAVTRRLEAAGRTLGVEVLDHIVVASQGSVSIRAAG
ncbi:JAB domain-containing protein [Phycisphaera mikurensis]|uniref:MPN domain-containing protein n=1 Tax=Phycisphaera mikurensis (strain NBRC 102666 / KCTC 22515 / FYK2301M01) TaxID=1142394 RepID=I0IJD6_PHYMF|nr:DNA repair protein RadC [Phycisphaera mikurensis]MBB6443202.1 DNA repair protein RadC [Phycisphaera mikurensis]BAM05374.1 hypothetical protein PSMK_p00120 [Phycisphaera mikurensis NBRC 102666]